MSKTVEVTEDNKQAPTVWMNQIQTKNGKQFLRSRNVKVNGVEVQLRGHLIKKDDGTISLALHFDPPYDRESREVLEGLGA